MKRARKPAPAVLRLVVGLVLAACTPEASTAPSATGDPSSPSASVVAATAAPIASATPRPPAIPVGAVLFFTLPSCPEGWSESSDARGRIVVGLTSGGTLRGTVGDALGDLEDRGHVQFVLQRTVGTTPHPGMTHQVDPPSWPTTEFNSVQSAVAGVLDEHRFIASRARHGHTLDIPQFTSGASGPHQHEVAISQARTGASSVQAVLPYVQLLACRKDSAAAEITTGEVAYFDIASCPNGWSEMAEAKGRAIVGRLPGGTLLGIVGEEALADTEDRVHAHGSIAQIVVLTTESGVHTHRVDPPSTNLTPLASVSERVRGVGDAKFIIDAASHTHSVNIPPFDTRPSGQHRHEVTILSISTGGARTSQVMPYLQLLACRKDSAAAPAIATGQLASFDLANCPAGWSEMIEAKGRVIVGRPTNGTLRGSVGDALGDLEDRAHAHAVGAVVTNTSLGGAHSHALVPTTTTSSLYEAPGVGVWLPTDANSYIIGSRLHSHNVTFEAFADQFTGEHAHGVTLPATQTTVARTSAVIPYLQLLACRKD